MVLSRGAQRCFSFLKSLARFSGRAFPLQETVAIRLGCKRRMVRYYLAELREAGLIVATKKRQHSSAEYVLSQTGNDCRSGCRSEPKYCRSEPPRLLMREKIIAEEVTALDLETQKLITWAVSQGMPVETGGDVFRAQMAYSGARKPMGVAGALEARSVAL